MHVKNKVISSSNDEEIQEVKHALKLPDGTSPARRCLTAVVSSVLFFVAAYSLFPVLFETNDDSAIQMILSGSLSGGEPEAHVIYVNYTLAFVISRLFALAPTVPWWAFAHVTILFISITLFNYTLVAIFERLLAARNKGVPSRPFRLGMVGTCLLLDLVIFLYPVLRMQFSLTPAVASGCVIFSCVLLLDIFSIKRRAQTKLNAVRALLLVLAFAFRLESGLIGFMFFALLAALFAILGKGDASYKGAFKTLSLILGISTVAIFSLYVSDRVAYSTDAWKEFQETNYARSLYMDYPHPSYDENPGLYQAAGWSKVDYQLVSNWCFMDARYSRESFDKICAGSPTNYFNGELNWLDDWLLRTNQFESLVFSAYATVSIGVTLLTLAFMKQGAIRRTVALGGIATLALISYLSLRGRLIFHAAFPVLFPMSVLSATCMVIQQAGSFISPEPRGISRKLVLGPSDLLIGLVAVILMVASYIQNGGLGRVLYLFAGIGVLLVIVAKAEGRIRSNKAINRARFVFYAGSMIALLALQGGVVTSRLGASDASTAQQLAANASFALGERAARANEDTVYIVPTVEYSTTDPRVTQYPSNMFAWGGWPYYTPWRQEAMRESTGEGKVLSLVDLLDNPTVELMTQNEANADLVAAYFEERIGEQIIVRSSTRNGVTIYTFSLPKTQDN